MHFSFCISPYISHSDIGDVESTAELQIPLSPTSFPHSVAPTNSEFS